MTEPEVPAPEGLLANVWVRAPDAFWSKVQSGASGAIALLPPTVGELACAAGGLEVRIASMIDGKGTSYGAIAEGEGGGLAWTLALPVTDAFGVAHALTPAGEGGSAPREVAGFRMVPAGNGGPAVVVALGSRWLMLAGSEADLRKLGPYVAGTLPRAAAPSEVAAVVVDVPQSALAGPLSRRLAASWDEGRAWLVARDEEQRAKHGGRAPDFGDPRVVVDAVDGVVKRREALVAGARRARLTVDASEDDVHAELVVTPGTDAASAATLAALHPGTSKPLADLPGDAVLAVLARDDAAVRADDAAALEATVVRALGDRVHAEDTRALHVALDDWAHGRGDWWAAALGLGTADGTRGIWLRAPAADPDVAVRAVREMAELSRRPLVSDVLAGSLHLSPAKITAADVPSLGKASFATFTPLGATGKTAAASLGLGWGVHDGQLLLAAGPSPATLLATEAAPPKRVGDAPRSAKAIASLGETATFALFARPLAFDAARGGTDAGAAPATFAVGRRGDDVWARVELADILLRELLHLEAGL
ncbi:MAG TPA: hypothetical protein VIF09_22315 [Polyangiaceae bacterium]